MPLSLPFAGPLASFTAILRQLIPGIAARGAGPTPLPALLVVAIAGYLSRTLRRFASLVARAQSGRPIVQRPGSPTRIRPAPNPATPARPRLPHAQAWLLPLVPVNAACAGSQLQHLLAQPEMLALIQVAPTLGRLLRPLARMLNVTLPEALLLRARPRRRRTRPVPAMLRVGGVLVRELPRYDRRRGVFSAASAVRGRGGGGA